MKRRKLRPQAVVALIVVILIFIGVAFLIVKNKKPALSMTFKEEKTVIEYGDTTIKPEEFVESFTADEVIYPKLNTLKVGEYKITYVLKSKKKEKSVEHTIEVKDTYAPEITFKQDEVEISVGDDYDLTSNIESVKDVIDGEINYKETVNEDEFNYYTVLSEVDLNTTGEYTVNIEAVDSNGNHSNTSYVLKVVEKEVISNPDGDYSSGDNQPTYINGILIVNKKYGIPADFGGYNPEASGALEELQLGASQAGYSIPLISGWRSYDYQVELYNSYVATDGQEAADRYSARPGFSEHQTGLCFDIGSIDDYYGETVEGQWLAAHAHEYGFIIRYPQGKEHITGYMYEPWHVRYVGKDVAADIYNQQITLEEYLGVSG